MQPLSAQQTGFFEFFVPLREIILDPEETFSGSEMVSDLHQALAMAEKVQPGGPCSADVLAMLSLVEYKRSRPAEMGEAARRSLEIQERVGVLDPENLMWLHLRAAVGAELAGERDRAAGHVAALRKHAAESSGLDLDKQLGMLEEYGYTLHECECFRAARDINLVLLTEAEAAFGPRSLKLHGVLNNLAQNEYMLGDYAAARPWLLRRLELAREHGDHEKTADTIQQLGVLAIEEGDGPAGLRLLREAADVAEQAALPKDARRYRRQTAYYEKKLG